MSIPVKTGTVVTDSFTMDYAELGDGDKNFVLLPGVSIQKVVPQAEEVASGYAAIINAGNKIFLFDRKNDFKSGYSVAQMAEDTFIAVKKLGIEKAVFMGTSQGGMMVQEIAINHPEAVEKIILASTSSRPCSEADSVFKNWIALGKKRDRAALDKNFSDLFFSKEFAEKFSDVLLNSNAAATDNDLDRFIILSEACMHHDAYDRLGEITAPTFVIGEATDKVLTGKASFDIAEKLGCECFMYSGFGHAVFDEAPDYKEKLLEFLNK